MRQVWEGIAVVQSFGGLVFINFDGAGMVSVRWAVWFPGCAGRSALLCAVPLRY